MPASLCFVASKMPHLRLLVLLLGWWPRDGVAAPQLSLTIVGPGRSAAHPTFGVSVQLQIGGCDAHSSTSVAGTAAACPPWVKIDRTTLVHGVIKFPSIMHRPAWGPLTLTFGSSADNRPMSFVAAGWSSEYNGTRLTPNSTAATVYYDVGYRSTQFTLAAANTGPGSVRLHIEPVKASLPPGFPATSQPFDAVRFDRFVRSDSGSTSPPQFSSSYFYHQESADGSLRLTFQQPGIYFYAALPSWQGCDGGSSAAGRGGGGTTRHPRGNEKWTSPTALVVRGANGKTGNQSIPAGFAGDVHELTPLMLPHQFCIIERNMTVFSGSQLRLPLCKESLNGAHNPQPGLVSVVAPSWLQLQGQNSRTCRTCPSHEGLNGAMNSSILDSSARLPGGLTRWTFRSPSARWARYNDFAPLYVSFDPIHATSTTVMAMHVMIHSDPTAAVSTSLAKWQTLNIRTVATPQMPLPKRLVTSLTWTDRSLFLDDDSSSSSGSGGGDYMATYRRLGFNTVPWTDMVGILLSNATDFRSDPANPAPTWYFPAGRTGPEWEGMLYGPEGAHGPAPGDGPSICKQKPDKSLLPSGLSAAEIKAEMSQWQNAYQYHKATGQIDIGYRGIFFKDSAKLWCSLITLTQPDWIWLDDECYGQGWSLWSESIALSANAQARAMPQEKPLDLAWRMVAEVMTDWMACVDQTKTTVAWYGNPFPDRIFSQAGISMTPSSYGPVHYPLALAEYTRAMKQQQSPMPNGKPRHLLPWLTACTYGQMDAVQTWEGALHSFGGGATGFSFFIGSCLDNPGKVLALSSATALATLFEDHFLEGRPMLSTQLDCMTGQLRAWSGMQLKQCMWIVLTPGSTGRTAASNLVVKILASPAMAVTFSACDLTTGQAFATEATADGVKVTAPLSRTTVVQVAPGANCSGSKLPAGAWLPVAGYDH